MPRFELGVLVQARDLARILRNDYGRAGVRPAGNAELAIAENTRSFHVELFAAGGRILFGGLRDIDQRKDEQAFDVLASAARYPATVFDMRPLRSLLRRTPVDRLSARDASLLYSADAYDAIVCYREVTPMTDPRAPL